MANVIKHKRGSGSDPVASDLVVGEVAIRTDVGKLFTKMDNGSVAEIAGGGSDIAINTLSSSSGTGGGSATFNGSAFRFTLSSPPSVSAQQLLVSINGVIQKPVAGTGQPSEGFSVDGTDIILGDAPATGSDFFILTFKSLGVSEPADNSVTSAKIVDGAIVNADINASAAIAGTKISPDFGSQTVITDGVSLVGLSSTLSSNTAKLQVAHTNGNADIIVHRAGNNANPPGLNFQKTRNASIGNYGTAVQNNDELGSIRWGGADGSAIAFAARIVGAVDGTPGANDMPGRIQFHTSSDGSEGLTERMRIGSNGDITVNFDGAGNQTGQLVIADGTESAPGLSFWADGSNDTGIFRSGANTLNFSTGGSERMRIDSSGSVIIGDDASDKANGHFNDLVVGACDSSTETHGITIVCGNAATNGGIAFSDGSNGGADAYRGMIIYQHNDNHMQFRTNASERMRIDSSGRVLVGTSTQFGDGNDKLMIEKGTDGGRIAFGTSAGFSECIIGQVSAYWADNKKVAAISFFGGSDTSNKDDGTIRFATSSANNLTECMRIDSSGRININTTSNTFDGVKGNLNIANTNTNNNTVINCSRNTANGRSQIRFSNPNGNVGSITTSGSGTSYNEASDYRLKENEVTISDGIARLKQLKPYRFNFKADASTTVDGFFAHEVSTIVPEAVFGDKDAVMEDGSIDPQGMDKSKLVPLLVAAVQEAIGRIEALEAK